MPNQKQFIHPSKQPSMLQKAVLFDAFKYFNALSIFADCSLYVRLQGKLKEIVVVKTGQASDCLTLRLLLIELCLLFKFFNQNVS